MAALRYAPKNTVLTMLFSSSAGQPARGANLDRHRGQGSANCSHLIQVKAYYLVRRRLRFLRAAAQHGWEPKPAVLTPEDLFTADAVWLVSSVRIAVNVATVDGREQPQARCPDTEAEFRAMCDEGTRAPAQ